MIKATTIDYIIGLPPSNIHDYTNTVMENSMPICRIYPGVPSFTDGISLFTRRPLFSSNSNNSKNKGELSYLELLKREKITLNQSSSKLSGDCLTIAFLADSFPTDSFTNEYGENIFQSFTDVASEKAASLMQIMGARSADQAISKLTASLSESKNAIVSGIGKGLDVAQNTAKGVLESLPPSISGGVNLVSALAAGSRIDFPMLWKSSGFQPSYTMTIRLYNPRPGDPDSTRKYIIAPIAALMLLGIPISADGKTYSWPFIHKIEAPGIFNLDPAFISNITVIKGGDQQQISFKQTLGVVDVRIDFGSLFNSILAGRSSAGRPTLTSYLEAMDSSKSGVKKLSSSGLTQAERQNAYAQDVSSSEVNILKNKAPTTSEITTEERQNPTKRVSDTVKNKADEMLNRSTSNIYNIEV